MMNRKGQGALEYLLLIGGALIVVAVVLTVLPNLASGGKDAAKQSGQQALDVIKGGLIDCGDYLTQNLCKSNETCCWNVDNPGQDGNVCMLIGDYTKDPDTGKCN